jgi:lipoprotein NlpD
MKHRPVIRKFLDEARSGRLRSRDVRSMGLTRYRALAIAISASLLLAACSSSPPAPVVDLSTRPEAPADDGAARRAASSGGSYRVVRGDTLYAIAFRNGVDFRELATWNGIEPPYRIYVGQDLRLGPSAPSPNSRAAAAAPPTPGRAPAAVVSATPSSPVTQSGKPAASSGSMFEDVPTTPAEARDEAPSTSAPPPRTPPADAVPPPALAAPSAKATGAEAPGKPPPPPKSSEDGAVNGAGGLVWRWPGKGPLIGSFVAGDQTRQGIDIGGTAGDPVLAAADGEVVYSGNGLLGYGELIIVKHNASFLSAYGHNRKRLVQEGDRIKSGQQIAEMGSSASARDELHFEIRKNGKPVNPLDYLPGR